VVRAARYAATHPALTGRTLTAGATISGADPEYISAPRIQNTARTPATPLASDTVWVAADVTNAGGIATVTLTRIAGASPARR